MKLSQFAHKIFLKKDTYAIFNSLLFKPILLSKNEVNNLFSNRLESFSSEEIASLKENGILINSEQQDFDAEKLLVQTINNQVGSFSLMYIIPVSGCNLGCKYCFIGKINNHTMICMSEQTLLNALQKFSTYLQEHKMKDGTVLFYGGEPTLKFNLVKKAVLFGKTQPVKMKFSIITNGTLLTEEYMKFIKENNIQLSISLDGPKELTDHSRIFKEYNNSVYDTVVQKIQKLRKLNIEFGLSVTLSKDALDYPQLKNWLSEIGVTGFGFNPLIFSQPTNEWKTYYKRVSKFLFELRDYLVPQNITEERLGRKYTAFYSSTFKYNDCPARGGEQFVVTPNGDVVVCHGYWNQPHGEVCGNINKDSIKTIQQSRNYKKWKNNLTVNKQKCLKCPAIRICGGGCAYQADKVFGKQTHIDEPNCIYVKYALKELLKRSLT